MSRIEQIESLFHEALTLPTADRAEWLEARCRQDPDVLQEVASLLGAHSELTRTLVAGFAAEPASPEKDPVAGRTDRLGPYRLGELIGSGGMGVVYVAHRVDGEFEQKVAIKVMGRHLPGEAFLSGFRNERQVLARLNHPNITRLLDGGVSETGEPYLVMEYIDGQPVDTYCNSRRLPSDERLRLFEQVCQAVEYLHRNLIVHRDLKPGNLLVDRDGNVKLLDFGTAKLLGDRAATATQAGLMTPRYASPEQVRAEPVTTVSDVFSLGVILYELLTGVWPFGNPKSALDEIDRVVRGRRASHPSAVVTQVGANERSVSRERLQRELSGDLSTILLKMLESEPAQRYGSVRQVEEDLERYRQGRPILARPQTAWYAARKFVRRNWLGVSAAGLAVLAVAGLTVFSRYQSVQAREQAARAQRVAEFAKNTFLSASSTWTSPLRGQSRAIQFSDILDNAAERVGKELGNDPVAEADLRGTLGGTYAILGDPVKGETQLRLAIQRLEQTPSRSSRIAADLRLLLCNTLSYESRYAEALTSCRTSLALVRVYGSTYGLSGILHDTAFMTVKSGASLEDAEKLYREALVAPPPDGAKWKIYPAIINTRIGSLRLRLGDLAEGERLLRGAERVLCAEPGPPIEIVPALAALAFGARIRGQYNDGIRLLGESVDLLTQRPTAYMGRDQVELDLAAAEALSGMPEALSRFHKVEAGLQIEESAPVDRVRLEMLAGTVEAHCGLPESAERRFRFALATSEKELPRQPADRVEIYVRLAQLLARSGKEQDAAEVARQGLRTAELAYGGFSPQHPFVSDLRKFLR